MSSTSHAPSPSITTCSNCRSARARAPSADDACMCVCCACQRVFVLLAASERPLRGHAHADDRFGVARQRFRVTRATHAMRTSAASAWRA